VFSHRVRDGDQRHAIAHAIHRRIYPHRMDARIRFAVASLSIVSSVSVRRAPLLAPGAAARMRRERLRRSSGFGRLRAGGGSPLQVSPRPHERAADHGVRACHQTTLIRIFRMTASDHCALRMADPARFAPLKPFPRRAVGSASHGLPYFLRPAHRSSFGSLSFRLSPRPFPPATLTSSRRPRFRTSIG
jgi:hypothetical protein